MIAIVAERIVASLWKRFFCQHRRWQQSILSGGVELNDLVVAISSQYGSLY
jgi:hypothetical protein